MITGALTLIPVPGVPMIGAGDDLPAIVERAITRAGMLLQPDDVVVVASKLVSRAEGRFVDLSAVTATPRAHELAAVTGHDPRLVDVILRDTVAVSRAAPGVLIVRHHLGHISANAGVDASNARPSADAAGGPWVLTLPEDPDRSARALRERLGVAGVVITDSVGRPFRRGSTGIALGLAGLPAVRDHLGQTDLVGRPLKHTLTAVGDQIATAADLVAGQGDEGRGVVVVRGVRFEPDPSSQATDLHRDPSKDLYA